MAKISFEFSDAAFEVLEQLAARQDVSVSEFARRALLAKMEDDEDILAADQAYGEYLQNPERIISEAYLSIVHYLCD